MSQSDAMNEGESNPLMYPDADPTGVTMDTVGQRIDEAKNAAQQLRMTAYGDDVLHSENPDELPKISMGFYLENLETAAQLGKVQTLLDTLPAVESTVILDTKMAWLTAPDSLKSMEVVDFLAGNGIKAWPTSTTLLQKHDAAERRSQRARRLEEIKTRQDKRLSSRDPRRKKRDIERPDQDELVQEMNALFTDRRLITLPRLVVAVLCGVPVILLTLIQHWQFDYWQWLCFVLAIPVVTWSAWPFHKAAIKGLKYRHWALDTASATAISAAFLWSTCGLLFTDIGEVGWHSNPVYFAWKHSSQAGSGSLFFDVACGATILLLIGRQLSRFTQLRSRLQLQQLHVPPMDEVEVARRDKGQATRVEKPVCELLESEDIVIHTGQQIPVDGIVIGGKSHIDLGPVGGNKRNVEVKVNDLVYAGGTNLGNELKIRILKTGSQTMLAAMKMWVRNSFTEENRSAALSTRGASMIVSWALLISFMTFFIWWVITQNPNQAFGAAVSILAAVAPVALAVSGPFATVLALGRAASQGVLIKGPLSFAKLSAVDTVIFNRSGTLTSKPIHITSINAMPGENAELILRVAGALSLNSIYDANQAIVRADRTSRISEKNGSFPKRLEAESIRLTDSGAYTGTITIPAHGTHPEHTVEASLWRPKEVSDLSSPQLINAVLSGGTPLIVSWDGEARGVIGLADTVKPDAVDAVESLEDMGVMTTMITRDAYPVARRTADYLGINTVLAGISSADKPHAVRAVHAQGATVACVGGRDMQDSMEVADIGMLMGATEHFDNVKADVVLIRQDVDAVGQTLAFSSDVRKTVFSNISFSWIYNIVAVIVAMCGLLHPLLATVLMLASSLIVESRCAKLSGTGFETKHSKAHGKPRTKKKSHAGASTTIHSG